MMVLKRGSYIALLESYVMKKLLENNVLHGICVSKDFIVKHNKY